MLSIFRLNMFFSFYKYKNVHFQFKKLILLLTLPSFYIKGGTVLYKKIVSFSFFIYRNMNYNITHYFSIYVALFFKSKFLNKTKVSHQYCFHSLISFSLLYRYLQFVNHPMKKIIILCSCVFLLSNSVPKRIILLKIFSVACMGRNMLGYSIRTYILTYIRLSQSLDENKLCQKFFFFFSKSIVFD